MNGTFISEYFNNTNASGTLISEYFNSDNTTTKAVVIKADGGYYIEYYIQNALAKSEFFENQSLQFVENAAENWALGVKPLNG